jgi:hypothetical protein
MTTRLASLFTSLALAACATQDPGPTDTYRHGADTLLACSNGGLVLTTGTATVQGWFDRDTEIGTVGATGAVAIALAPGDDGALIDATGTWTRDDQPDVGASSACDDLETQPWFALPPHRLPVASAFASPVFASEDACAAAKASGGYPEVGRCYYYLLACPGGKAYELLGDVSVEGTYTTHDGTMTLSSVLSDYGSTATFRADGTLTWSPASASPPGWTTMSLDGPIASDLDCLPGD